MHDKQWGLQKREEVWLAADEREKRNGYGVDKDESKGGGVREGRREGGWMDAEWRNRWMGVRWLERSMLHIGIDPQEGPSKIEWHLWRRWLCRPALGSRHRKPWHCQLCWENCGCSWLLLSHRHFLYRSTGQGPRGLVSCRGWYTCSVSNMDWERNETSWSETFYCSLENLPCTCNEHIYWKKHTAQITRCLKVTSS